MMMMTTEKNNDHEHSQKPFCSTGMGMPGMGLGAPMGAAPMPGRSKAGRWEDWLLPKWMKPPSPEVPGYCFVFFL